jgi:hypothetical protein
MKFEGSWEEVAALLFGMKTVQKQILNNLKISE